MPGNPLSLLTILAIATQSPPKVAMEKVTLLSGKDRVQAVCYLPAGKGTYPGVIVLHGDFGLTDWLKQQAARLADKGYVTLAVDLYRGEIAKDIEEAHILERALLEERVLGDVKAAANYLLTRSDVHKDSLGVIGWDMGGGYALQAACSDARLRAVVVCYGRLITDAAVLRQLHGSVLGIFAGKDEGISPEIIEQFRKAMHKADKRLGGIEVFPALPNGFMDPANPYRSGPVPKELIARAWTRIDAYLARELKR
jgi:carboxymethylenebutenolidase